MTLRDLPAVRLPAAEITRTGYDTPTLLALASDKVSMAERCHFALASRSRICYFPLTSMPSGPTQHVPVLPQEVLEWLRPAPGQTFVDGTLGGGGHARLLAERVSPGGLVIGLDRDPIAIERTAIELQHVPLRAIHGNYSDIPETLAELAIPHVDGILLDLGLSSDQLADSNRGFSFQSDGPLDLRFDTSRGFPAWKMIDRLSAEHLADLIYEFGEERYSRRIARRIVEARRTASIQTASELARVIRESVPRKHNDRIDPATRTFQALRIAVNEELKWLKVALRRLPDCLRPGGRIAIISFHSLEDRMVKESFRNDERLTVQTRRPLRATEEEVETNPRSRSAKFRVAERNEIEPASQ